MSLVCLRFNSWDSLWECQVLLWKVNHVLHRIRKCCSRDQLQMINMQFVCVLPCVHIVCEQESCREVLAFSFPSASVLPLNAPQIFVWGESTRRLNFKNRLWAQPNTEMNTWINLEWCLNNELQHFNRNSLDSKPKAPFFCSVRSNFWIMKLY